MTAPIVTLRLSLVEARLLLRRLRYGMLTAEERQRVSRVTAHLEEAVAGAEARTGGTAA